MAKTKIINFSDLQQRGFSSEDLDTHRSLISKQSDDGFSQEPWRYYTEEYKWMGDRIIPLANITIGGKDEAIGDELLYQSARSGHNSQQDNIKHSIETVGFDLDTLPIAVRPIGSDEKGVNKYELLDGRTRYTILRSLGITNVIVDVFDIKHVDQMIAFGIQANNAELASGQATKEDMLGVILALIDAKSELVKLPFAVNNIGLAKYDNDQIRQRRFKVASVLNNAIDFLGNNRFDQKKKDWIITKVIETGQKEPLVRSFTEKSAEKYIHSKFGIVTRNKSGKDGVYVGITTQGGEGKWGTVLQGLIDKLSEPHIHRSEVILVCGSPGHAQPETKWLRATQRAIGKFNQALEDLNDVIGNGDPANLHRIKNKISIRGAVPQLKSLEEHFPLDRLVREEDFNATEDYKIPLTRKQQAEAEARYNNENGGKGLYAEAAG